MEITRRWSKRCHRPATRIGLCGRTEPGSPGPIHCIRNRQAVVRLLRQTSDALRAFWRGGQDTGGPERAKEGDDLATGDGPVEIAGRSRDPGPHSQTLRLPAAGEATDGHDSRRRNPTAPADSFRPLKQLDERDRLDLRDEVEIQSVHVARFPQVPRSTLTSARCLSGHSSLPAPTTWPRRTTPPIRPPLLLRAPRPDSPDHDSHPTNEPYRQAAQRL